MLYEYAIEPEALASDWRTFKYLVEKFGFDRGRLIAEFPKSWLRRVYDASASQGDMDRKRIEQLLARAKQSLVRSGRPYDVAGDWLSNAVAQHALAPFHAIIAAENPLLNPSVLVATDVDETDPLFQTATGWQVERTGVALATAMRPLIRNAREVWLVDPFFNILDPAYTETLRESLRIAATSANPATHWLIHYREHDSRPSTADVARRVPGVLAGVIPRGFRLSLYGWRERLGGEDFHARYLLTDRGGLSVESGFSAVGAHQRVDVHLLAPAIWQTGREAFSIGAAYDRDGPILEIDSDCRAALA
jgi:hypothetical protein